MALTVRTIVLFLVTFALASCGWPRVHRISIQQGNVISQEMVDRLKPGMTRSQVAFIMGQPVFRNAFDVDRWDYIYTLNVPNVMQTRQRVSLYFEDDVLAFFTGDLVPSDVMPGNNSEPETADASSATPEAQADAAAL